jgi:hypothetical protein
LLFAGTLLSAAAAAAFCAAAAGGGVVLWSRRWSVVLSCVDIFYQFYIFNLQWLLPK